MIYLSKTFWIATAERAIKSAVQAVIGAGLLSTAGPVNAFELDYKLALGIALGGAILSCLTSVASTSVGDPDSPSAV